MDLTDRQKVVQNALRKDLEACSTMEFPGYGHAREKRQLDTKKLAPRSVLGSKKHAYGG